MTGQHRPPPPPRLTLGRVAIAARGHLPSRRRVVNGLLTVALSLPVAAVTAAANEAAPDARQPTPAAAPTAVELREPTGHGGPLNPPTFADPHVWEPSKGPVIADGQALPQPTATADVPVVTEPTPEPAPVVVETPTAAAAKAAPPADTGLLALVNADRANAGCAPVTIAADLTTQAQTHSNGQAAADAMFHSAGVRGYDSWGENVAQGYDSAAEVHAAWVASTGHRRNILNCKFTVIGYAFADGESGRYWTEMFAR